MHIGLFGGAFDPPHNGHKKVAEELLAKNLVDEVWFVPVHTHPWAKRFGKEFLTQYEIRLEMVRALSESIPQSFVAEFHDVSYTYPTLEFFTKKYPEHTFSWIMGSEYLPKFDDFLKEHPKLLLHHFFVYPRQGVPFQPEYENMTFLSEMEEVDVSSSEIRQLVAEGQECNDLVLPEILDVLIQHKLYFFKQDN